MRPLHIERFLPFQPPVLSVPGRLVVLPVCDMRTTVIDGRPNAASNVSKSLWIFGSSKASTMAMVWPVPSPMTPPLKVI